MESAFSSLGLCVAALVIIAVYVIYSYVFGPYQLLKRFGFNGPKPSPFLGHYRILRKLGWLKFYGEMYQKYGPVCAFYIGRQPHLMVADLDMIKLITVKKFDSFMDRPGGIQDLFYKAAGILPELAFTKGDTWKRARQTMSPSFSAMKIKKMVPLIKKSCDTLLMKLEECASSGKSVDISKVYQSFTMETVLKLSFGREVNVQLGEADQLTDAANFVVSHETALPIPLMSLLLSEFPFLAPLFVWLIRREWQGRGPILLHSTAVGLLQARRADVNAAAKYNDVLQLLINQSQMKDDGTAAHGGQRFTDQEIVGVAVGFLTGAYEEIYNALGYTTYLLALHPSVQDRLHIEIEKYLENNPDANPYDATHEIQYLDMVFNEAIRLYPTAPRTWRQCSKTTDINGVTVPKGVGVHIPIYNIHRITEYWPDPEKFDPNRFTPEEKAKRPQLAHLPFGWGPRNCIGMPLALLEVKMTLIEVLRKYKFVQSPETEVPLETVLPGLNLLVKNGVHIKISLRD